MCALNSDAACSNSLPALRAFDVKANSNVDPSGASPNRRSVRMNTFRDASSAETRDAVLMISSAESARENALRASASAPWASSTIQ